MKSVENEIGEANAEQNYKFIKESLDHLVDDTDNLNCIKMWELKKKLCPKKTENPTAKKNQKGELVTDPTKLRELYKVTYMKRLEHRRMKPELIQMYD